MQKALRCLFFFLLSAVLVLLSTAAVLGGQAPKAALPSDQVDATQYVGTDTCKTCHHAER